MRFASPRLAVTIFVVILAVAGCGGATVTVQEVPGEPAELSVPGTGAALAPEATASPTPTATETANADGAASATATPEGSGTGDATAETAPEGTDGGATTAPGADDGAATDQPPPAGSNAEEFENFCAENPGAC
jgi:hypothetical protein